MNLKSWRERMYVMPVMIHHITPDPTTFDLAFMSLRLSTRHRNVECRVVAFPAPSHR